MCHTNSRRAGPATSRNGVDRLKKAEWVKHNFQAARDANVAKLMHNCNITFQNFWVSWRPLRALNPSEKLRGTPIIFLGGSKPPLGAAHISKIDELLKHPKHESK